MGGKNNEDYPDLALTKEKPESVVFRLPCGVLFMRHSDDSACKRKLVKGMSKCRVWVGRVSALVGDRNAEVRRAACQALHLVYTRMDGPTLLTHVAHASPPDQVITS